ncbi:MAG TPA: hypothetical protein EYP85_03275 [Armatimonadetes bacterium]|nr:hypothetical protein [Armatimonadota bacterium]
MARDVIWVIFGLIPGFLALLWDLAGDLYFRSQGRIRPPDPVRAQRIEWFAVIYLLAYTILALVAYNPQGSEQLFEVAMVIALPFVGSAIVVVRLARKHQVVEEQTPSLRALRDACAARQARLREGHARLTRLLRDARAFLDTYQRHRGRHLPSVEANALYITRLVQQLPKDLQAYDALDMRYTLHLRALREAMELDMFRQPQLSPQAQERLEQFRAQQEELDAECDALLKQYADEERIREMLQFT